MLINAPGRPVNSPPKSQTLQLDFFVGLVKKQDLHFWSSVRSSWLTQYNIITLLFHGCHYAYEPSFWIAPCIRKNRSEFLILSANLNRSKSASLGSIVVGCKRYRIPIPYYLQWCVRQGWYDSTAGSSVLLKLGLVTFDKQNLSIWPMWDVLHCWIW